jgi:hypothetical protein
MGPFKIRSGLALCIILTSCTHTSYFLGPHGEHMALIRCTAGMGTDDCKSQAREACGGDFQILDQTPARSDTIPGSERWALVAENAVLVCGGGSSNSPSAMGTPSSSQTSTASTSSTDGSPHSGN